MGFLGSSETSQIVQFHGEARKPIQFCKVDMDDGETYRFAKDISESILAAQVSNSEILVFMDLSDATNNFVKIRDPSAQVNSRIGFFCFIGSDRFLIANSAGYINIFKLSGETATQLYNYKLEPFVDTRELVIHGCKAKKEDFVAFLTSDYSRPWETASSIHLYEVGEDREQIHQDMVINMELFREHGYDPNLVSVNIDFDYNSYPYVIAFPRTTPFFYSLDISGESIQTKAVDVGQVNTKSIGFEDGRLFALDRAMQIIEVEKLYNY